ncbi:hypothetical protein [Tenacibaculum sp. nBUS_03]|uniref:hypothetical protein n=1 Tax=Tenacibaculum sp. nBUS_03 TaxID=3395320 RepID=UPI003EB7BD88
MEAVKTIETHKAVVEQLKSILDGNSAISKSLEESLKKAVSLSKYGNPDENIPPLNKIFTKRLIKSLKEKVGLKRLKLIMII